MFVTGPNSACRACRHFCVALHRASLLAAAFRHLSQLQSCLENVHVQVPGASPSVVARAPPRALFVVVPFSSRTHFAGTSWALLRRADLGVDLAESDLAKARAREGARAASGHF